MHKPQQAVLTLSVQMLVFPDGSFEAQTDIHLDTDQGARFTLPEVAPGLVRTAISAIRNHAENELELDLDDLGDCFTWREEGDRP